MKSVKVNLGKRSYRIFIETGALAKLPLLVKICNKKTPFFVITNKKVNARYGARLRKSLKKLSEKILFYEIPDSEKAKSFPIYIKTIKSLAHFARKTKPLVIAFGGGVVGDLAGFIASTYRRGVPYVNIPTTLLSQVDSAIGGKVAIDIKNAKNIVGDFYQPKMVLCDLQFLKSLPPNEVRNGLVEIVKYGVIKDRGFFSFIEKNLTKILKFQSAALEHVIFKSCSIKARIVEKDELDRKDVRAILNFGHTLGHAIEAASRYSKSITHGRAVAAGMAMASFIALRLGMLKEAEYKRIISLIKRVAPEIGIKHLRPKDILETLSYDKKFIHGVNRFILPKKIGRVLIINNIPEALIKKAIAKMMED